MAVRRKSKAKPLLAYEATDGGDSWCIVFATNNAAARRMAANEFGTDFEGVESVRRRATFDEYAPGPVPLRAQWGAGWRFECTGCNEPIGEDTDIVYSTEEPEGVPLNPVFHDQAVFCTPECELRHDLNKARSAAVLAAVKLDLARVVHTRYPGAVIERLHGYESRGIVSDVVAFFRVPGLRETVRYDHNRNEISVYPCDLGAWDRYLNGLEEPLFAWESEGGAISAREVAS